MKTINISTLLSSEIHSRNQAKMILEQINTINDKKIQLNFKNVNFISRSFADELCEVISIVSKDNKEVTFINRNSEITNILTIITKSRTLTKKNNSDSSTYQFNNISSLSEFLATI